MIDRSRALVVGVPIDVVGWDQAVERISKWARDRESRVVCICNVHSVVTARKGREFFNVISASDMATPDGAPVAWMLGHITGIKQQRINGPDLMWKYCASAEISGESIYLYGASEETLLALREALIASFPKLRIAGQHSPPYRPLTDREDDQIVETINASGAGVVWVSLGCPKQEHWMIEHRGRIKAVMVGVGAAFDYHAGLLERAPLWMQRSGFEWLYRLIKEPRRLWRRYLVTNTVFVWQVVCTFVFRRFAKPAWLSADES